MGIWSGLKGQVPLAEVDPDWQSRVNIAKTRSRVEATEDGSVAYAEPAFMDLSKTDKARKYCELRDEKDELEAKVKALNVDLEALSQLMISEMEAEGSNSFRLATGESLSIKDEPYCSVENKDTFLTWVKESNLSDLLTVHYMTLSSMTKDRLKQGLNPPPGIKVFLKQSITRYRARS